MKAVGRLLLSAVIALALVTASGVGQTASSRPEYVVQAGHALAITSVAFSPDGRWLASGSADKAVKVWEVATGQQVRTFRGHTFWVRSVAFSPDGRSLASASGDKTVKL